MSVWMSADVKLSTRNALRVLRRGAFRRYIIGSSISDTGTWMQVMAQGYVMSTLTNKAIMLGMANFAVGLPMLLLTMVGRSAADRFDKRKILLTTQYVQIALAISIGLLVMSGKLEIWHILAFAVALGISNSFEMPTLNALVPELVTRGEIQSAIAVDRAVFHGSRVVGPSLAGIFISVWGSASAFFLNAISFVALIIALLTIPPRPRGTAEEEEKRASGIKDGFRYVAQDKPSLALTALFMVNSLGLVMNFGLANTIVQERAPYYLRWRVSAVFMLSFVGLMPVAGLGITGLSDLLGMRTALAIAAGCYAVIALIVLGRVRRQCSQPAIAETPAAETPAPPIAAAV